MSTNSFTLVIYYEHLIYQVKQLYNKITGQAESLKGLWIAKLNLKGRSALATDEDLLEYERKKNEVSRKNYFIWRNFHWEKFSRIPAFF